MGLELTRKNALAVPEHIYGVCLWEMPSGGYLSDGTGYLSVEGLVNSIAVEGKMREAVRYWTGSPEGKPKWFPGHRKISVDEHDDQKGRMGDGFIPDQVDEVRQTISRSK